jgi:hypothetical protein
MDYTWALAALVGAFYVMMNRRWAVAGVLTGVAIGARITTLVVIPAFLIAIFLDEDGFQRTNIKLATAYTASAIGVAAIFYLPGFVVYGFDLFSFVDDTGSVTATFKAVVLRVWGSLGTVAIVIALLGGLVSKSLRSRRESTFAQRPPNSIVVSSLAVIGVFLIVFLRLPVQAGYLITAVPFILLSLAVFLPRPLFWLVCVSLVLSPFVEVDRTGLHPGLLLQDRQVRKISMMKADNISRAIDGLQANKVVLIAGRLTPQMEVEAHESFSDHDRVLVITPSIETRSLAEYLAAGFDVYYIPDRDIYPETAAAQGWVKGGAKPLYY